MNEQLRQLRPTRVGLEILWWKILWRSLSAFVTGFLGAIGSAVFDFTDVSGVEALAIGALGAAAIAALTVVGNYAGGKVEG